MARGLKMLCTPVSPVGTRGHYRATIVGMPECDAFARVAGPVPAIQEYVNNDEIRGVTAPDDTRC